MGILECSYNFRQPWQKSHLPTEGLDEGSDVDFFSLEGKSKENPFLFVTTPAQVEPQTYQGYSRRILVMFTMALKDLKHADWPSWCPVISDLDYFGLVISDAKRWFRTVISDGVLWNRTPNSVVCYSTSLVLISLISDGRPNLGRWFLTVILDGVMFKTP